MEIGNIKDNAKIKLGLKAVICCLLWGTAFPVLKITYSELGMLPDDVMSKMVLAGMRFLLSGIIIFLYYSKVNNKVPHLSKKSILPFIIFGVLNTTLQYFFFYTGVDNTSAIKGVLLDTSKPLFVVIIAHFIYANDRITLNKIIGICLGFIGIIVANIEGARDGGLALGFTLYGEGFLILASVAYAIAAVYGKELSKKYEPIVMNCYQFIFGAIILLGIGLVGTGGFHLQFNALATILLIYSAFLSAIAFVLWFNLLQNNKASAVTVYVFLIPIFGTIISSTVLPDEVLTINVVISIILASIGIYFVNKEDKLEIHTEEINKLL